MSGFLRYRLMGELIVTHATDAADSSLATASTEKVYRVSRADLPLSCPMPDQHLWNSHPRVYLPIEKTGEAICPYCSAQYVLTD
jgi:uncharacterized Zn-finger protein